MYTIRPSRERAGAQLGATPVKLRLPETAAALIQVAWPRVSIRAIPLDKCAGVAPVTVNPKYSDPSGPAVSGVVIFTAWS